MTRRDYEDLVHDGLQFLWKLWGWLILLLLSPVCLLGWVHRRIRMENPRLR